MENNLKKYGLEENKKMYENHQNQRTVKPHALDFGVKFNHFRLKPEDFIATESRYCG